MNFLPIDTTNPNFEYETYLLIDEMEEFIMSIDCFILYASSILKLQHLPKEKKSSLEKAIFDAIDMWQLYHNYIEENVENLERRAEEICTEMERFERMMEENETLLDDCLIHADIQPKIKFQFVEGIPFISDCAEC